MSFTFTSVAIQALQLKLNDAVTSRNYVQVYQYIFDQISDVVDGEYIRKSDVDKSVWLWVRGALGVNKDDDSFFSDYIRDWTSTEFSLRNGYSMPISGIGSVQNASNDIADKFANDILSNHVLPNISNVGTYDAGSVAAGVFGGNYSPWAGTLLFAYLGDGQYVRNGLLNLGTTKTEDGAVMKAITGTYDLIAAAQTAHKISDAWDAIWNSGELEETISGNSIGEGATLLLLANLRNESNAFFQSAYGLPNVQAYQIGGDLPLYGNDYLGGQDYLDHPNYIVGTLHDDVGVDALHTIDKVLLIEDGADIVNAGLGDDVIYASTGDDLIDGAEGNDTLNFSLVQQGVHLSHEDVVGTLYTGRMNIISDDGEVNTYAYGIENYVLTDSNDTVSMQAQNAFETRTFDGGGGDDDHITYGGEDSSYYYDEKRGVVYGAGRDILKNIEDVSFTGGSVIINPDETKTRTLTGYFVDAGSGGSSGLENEHYNYSASTEAATFTLTTYDTTYRDSFGGNHYLQGGLFVKADVGFANGIHHQGSIMSATAHNFPYGSPYFPGWSYITGTNKGDTVSFVGSVSPYVAIRGGTGFISGWGDDTITISGSGVGVSYTGGDDVIHGQLKALNLAPDIHFEDVHVGSISVYPHDLGNGYFSYTADIEFNIDGHGSVSLKNIAYAHGSYDVLTVDMLLGSERRYLTISPGWQLQRGEIITSYEGVFLGGGTMLHDDQPIHWVGTSSGDGKYGSYSGDTLDGQGGNDTLYGSDGNDTLTGGSGTNILYGGYDNDTFIISGDGDKAYGEQGNDTYTLYAGSSSEIDDSYGSNKLLLDGQMLSSFSHRVNGNTLEIHDAATDALVTKIIDWHSFAGIQTADQVALITVQQFIASTATFIPTFYGSEDDDWYSPDWNLTEGARHLLLGGNDTFYGSYYNDVVDGGAGDDVIYGSGGNDKIIALAGNDMLYGDAGDDEYQISHEATVTIDDVEGSNKLKIIDFSLAETLITVSDGDLLLADSTHVFATIHNYKNYYNSSAYSEVDFADGFSVTIDSLLFVTQGTENDDNMFGIAHSELCISQLFGGNDIFSGISDSRDVVFGGTGDDRIYGDAGNDFLYGELGNDTLYGGAGNDFLYGGIDNDIIDGGFGNDQIDGGDGFDRVDYHTYSSVGVYVDLESGVVSQDGLNGVDHLTSIELVDGSFFDDIIKGSSNNDYLYGNAGNDTINGRGGDDYILGMDGDDVLDGGDGNDYIYGGTGTDTASYASSLSAVSVNLSLITAQNTLGAGTDTLLYIENIIGSDFNDILVGDGLGNALYGGLGNDSLNGGLANDTLYGGAGNDKYIYSSGSGKGNDLIEDESSSADKISFGSAYTAANTSLVRVGQYDLAIVSGGQNLFYIKNQFTLNGAIETVKWGDGSILNLLTYSHTLNGTAAGETLYGTSYGAGGDIINALGGADTVYAGAGNDVVSGGDDDDFLYGENGNDLLNGNAGNDTLNGGAGIDTASYVDATSFVSVNLSVVTAQNTLGSGVDTLIDIENITGSLFNDVLVGSDVANIIDGMDGNDTIQGDLGDDILRGGLGIDTVSYAAATALVKVNLEILTAQNTHGAGKDTLSGFENILGSIYNDTLTGDTGANTIDGGDGNDIIQGGLGDDILIGGSGTDTVTYAASTAAITLNLATLTAQNTGGAGTDTLSGFEYIIGSAYNDTLIGNSSSNKIEGGLGNDTLDGGAGTDTVSYASATSAVTVNLATTTAQNTGGAGTDLLANFESIYGSAFGDTLTGNASANTLTGATGADTVTGGLGADAFKFVMGSMDGTSDHITDYSTAQGDKIDLKDLLIGFDPITKLITDFVEFTDSGANTIMKVDRDGTGTAYGWQQIGFLDNVTGLTDEAALKASGNLIVV